MTLALDVLTLNLWNISEPLELRMSRLSSWLAGQPPDLLLLQEVSTFPGTSRDQAHELAASSGYAHVRIDASWRGDGREQGLAIVSRYPIGDVAVIELPEVEGDQHRIVQLATLVTPEGPLEVANTHFSWRLDDRPGRVRQAATLVEAIDAEPGGPLVIGGDFNDVHGSAPLGLIELAGCVDVCDDDRPTFASDNPWTEQEELFDRRVDHLFTRTVEADRAEVVLNGGDVRPVSDHYGVRCRLRM